MDGGAGMTQAFYSTVLGTTRTPTFFKHLSCKVSLEIITRSKNMISTEKHEELLTQVQSNSHAAGDSTTEFC